MKYSIVVVAKDDAVAKASLNHTVGAKSIVEMTPVVPGKKTTRVNCLGAVVECLKKINDLKLADTDEPVAFYVINNLKDIIDKGTALYWLRTNGKKMDGESISDVELKLWDEFYALYQANIRNIVFRDTSVANLVNGGRARFGITEEQRQVAERIDEAWRKVNNRIAQMVEDDTACI